VHVLVRGSCDQIFAHLRPRSSWCWISGSSAPLPVGEYRFVALRVSAASDLSRILAFASSPAWFLRTGSVAERRSRHWIRVGRTRIQTGVRRSRSRSAHADLTARAGPTAPAAVATADPDAAAVAAAGAAHFSASVTCSPAAGIVLVVGSFVTVLIIEKFEWAILRSRQVYFGFGLIVSRPRR